VAALLFRSRNFPADTSQGTPFLFSKPSQVVFFFLPRFLPHVPGTELKKTSLSSCRFYFTGLLGLNGPSQRSSPPQNLHRIAISVLDNFALSIPIISAPRQKKPPKKKKGRRLFFLAQRTPAFPVQGGLSLRLPRWFPPSQQLRRLFLPPPPWPRVELS